VRTTGGNLPAVRQLPDLPREELDDLADQLGLDPRAYRSRQYLIAAIHDRRQIIAEMDRDAMLDVIRWGRRVVAMNATREQIAQEIVRIQSMRFAGLSQRGLAVLGKLRGLDVAPEEPVPQLIHRLKKQEGVFTRLKRKRRAMMGSFISKMVGDQPAQPDAPPLLPGPTDSPSTAPPPPRGASVKEEIEDAGLIRGITGRIKKTADSYLNQKLDEIEARIDRKLDEIDRRLVEWRDKEIANRIRILKITLWASVIVAALSLLYSYIKVYFYPHM
jgi:hypothetical protein